MPSACASLWEIGMASHRQLNEIYRLELEASAVNGMSYVEAMRLPLKVFLRIRALQSIGEAMRSGYLFR
jgi:hypothetical protein